MEGRTRGGNWRKGGLEDKKRRRRFVGGHSAAISIALPNNEKDQSLNYLDQYSCKPPPIFLISLSLAQVFQKFSKNISPKSDLLTKTSKV